MEVRYECKVAVFLILTRIKDGKTEVLLQKRINTGYMDGKYDAAASGHLEKGESVSMAVVREAKEEINIDIEEKDLKFVQLIHPYQEGYVNVFFTTDKYKGNPEIMEGDKCEDLSWFNISELPDNIIPRIKNVLKNIELGILYDDGDFSQQQYKSKNN